MKIHTTTDINNLVTYYATRKEAVKAINASHFLFPHPIGIHYHTFEMGTKKADLVRVLNNCSKWADEDYLRKQGPIVWQAKD